MGGRSSSAANEKVAEVNRRLNDLLNQKDDEIIRLNNLIMESKIHGKEDIYS